MRRIYALLLSAAALLPVAAQAQQVLTLEQAVARARQYGGQVQSANLALLSATEDRVQARAATLPTVESLNSFIYTMPNGADSGVFVANNGPREFVAQAGVHQEVLPLFRHAEVRRAQAAEAVARARVDIAARGVAAVAVQNYYAVILAVRHLANAQRGVADAQRFFDITRQQEQRGEAARADVIRAQVDLQQRQRDVQEAESAIVRAKIGLSVIIFPDLNIDFDVTDDLLPAAALPALAESNAQATGTSPELRAANAGVQQAQFDLGTARYGYLPSLGVDVFYGLDANQFARRTTFPPGSDPLSQLNLGYAAAATLNIPVWNWGATRSRVKQAEYRRQQAQLDVSLTQRSLQGSVAAIHAEARIAQAQLDSLLSSVDLAGENLRLTLLRYQAGEATALEVVDAQNITTQSRNAYDDGLARYRAALANLQILTGAL